MGFLKSLEYGRNLLKSFGTRVRININDYGLDLNKYNPKNNYSNNLEGKVLSDDLADSDSGLNLAETKHDFRLSRNLYRVAHGELSNANGNLAGKVYDFMKNFIFNAKSFDYRNINETIEYLNILSSETDGEAKRAVETALTVMNHLNDYLIRQSEREDKSSSQGFKNYLFGERGVLTQKRLSDMIKASNVLSKKKSSLEERKNYKIGKDKEGFDALNASYTKNSQGRIFVNVNDDNSSGMYSQHGKLYWNVFDKMFDSSIDGDVNTRSAVTKYAKRHISNLKNEGKIDYIKWTDWKKDDIRNYAKFK